MTLPTETILKHVVELPSLQKIKVSVKQSVKCGVAVGAVTVLSGIFAGPLGIAAGGIVSSAVAAILSHGTFSSATYILLYETTEQEKEKLAQTIRAYLNSQHVHTILEYMLALKDNPNLEQILFQLIISFLTSEMGRKVTV